MNLLWLDIETTGLDPETNEMLELAAVATNQDLETLGTLHCVLKADEFVQALADDFVLKMHTDNGLWKACSESTMYLEDAARALREFIQVHFGEGKLKAEKPWLAGCSVHFDADWLDYDMPSIPAKLHHRRFDVRPLIQAFSMWGGEQFPTPKGTHRAMDDINDALNATRTIRSRLIGMSKSKWTGFC